MSYKNIHLVVGLLFLVFLTSSCDENKTVKIPESTTTLTQNQAERLADLFARRGVESLSREKEYESSYSFTASFACQNGANISMSGEGGLSNGGNPSTGTGYFVANVFATSTDATGCVESFDGQNINLDQAEVQWIYTSDTREIENTNILIQGGVTISGDALVSGVCAMDLKTTNSYSDVSGISFESGTISGKLCGVEINITY